MVDNRSTESLGDSIKILDNNDYFEYDEDIIYSIQDLSLRYSSFILDGLGGVWEDLGQFTGWKDTPL